MHAIFIIILLAGLGGSMMAADPFVDSFDLSKDTLWHSTNPGAGGAFGVVGAGPGGVIIVGGDLSGAYRSLDSGNSWDQIGSFRGLTDTHICGLGFDPENASIIFIGTEHGLFRSADTGSSFIKAINDGYITDITVAPSNTLIGYAAYHSKYNTTDGQVYRSTDNGLSWAKVSADLPTGLHILELLINPVNPDEVYLLSGRSDYSSGLRVAFRSVDGGIHWAQIGSSLGEVKDLKIDKSIPSTLYISTYPAAGDDFGYLYRSGDNGDNWNELVHRTGYIWLDQKDPKFIRLIELGYQYPGGSRSGVWASSDSGLNWFRFSDIGEDWDKGWSKYFHYGRSFNGDVKTFGEDMSDPDCLFWITSQWVFRSNDRGNSFQNLYTDEIFPNTWQSRGINNAVLFDIEISPANPDIIYLGYFDLGFFRSLDRGKSWENCNHPGYTVAWKGDGGSSYAIAADPTRQNVVWASQGQDRSSTKVLLRSSQSGNIESWERVGNGLPSTASHYGISIDRGSPDSCRTLLMTANKNVYISHDDGYNWSLSLDCGGKCHFTAIDRFNGNLVYAGGSGGIWRSAHGGAFGSWEQVGLTEMQGILAGDLWDYGWTGVTDIETDPSNPDWVYATVFGTNRGLFRSKDRGDTWDKLWTDSYLRGVAVSPANPELIFIASSKPLNSGGYNEKSNGVLKSGDGGTTWTKANEGLAWPFASAVEIDQVNPEFVLIASPGDGCSARNFILNGPVRTNLQPSGTLISGTKSTTISLTTNVVATCKYSTVPNTAFDDMENFFSVTEGTTHSEEIPGLSDNNTYQYYCRCRDESGNTNTDDFYITFHIADEASVVEEMPVQEKFGIQVISLPSGGVSFCADLSLPAGFKLRVYDIAGRLVWSYRQASAMPGLNEISWEDTSHKNLNLCGLYYVVLSSERGDKVASQLFMK